VRAPEGARIAPLLAELHELRWSPARDGGLQVRPRLPRPRQGPGVPGSATLRVRPYAVAPGAGPSALAGASEGGCRRRSRPWQAEPRLPSRN
jgi:hypothetical protein